MLLLAGCNLSTEAPTPFPTPDVPTIEFVSPPNGATVIDGVEIDIELLARDAGVGVARVELNVDDRPYSEATPEISAAVAEFAVLMNWRAEGVGRHALSAVALRPDGTRSDPATIIVQVLPDESAGGDS